MIFIDTFQGAICQMPRLCSIGSCTDMQSRQKMDTDTRGNASAAAIEAAAVIPLMEMKLITI